MAIILMEGMMEMEQRSREEIGKTLAAARKQRGISQVKLAVLLGYNVKHIARWERGTRPIPDRFLRQIAEALQIPVSTLLP